MLLKIVYGNAIAVFTHNQNKKMRNDRHYDHLPSPDYDRGKQSGGKDRKDHRKRQLWPLSGRPLDREERSRDFIKGYAKSYYWGTENMSESEFVDVVVRLPVEEYEAIEWKGLDRTAAFLKGVELLRGEENMPFLNLQIHELGEDYFSVFFEGLEVGDAFLKGDRWFFAIDEVADEKDYDPVPPEFQDPEAIAQFVAQKWQKQQEKGDQ